MIEFLEHLVVDYNEFRLSSMLAIDMIYIIALELNCFSNKFRFMNLCLNVIIMGDWEMRVDILRVNILNVSIVRRVDIYG